MATMVARSSSSASCGVISPVASGLGQRLRSAQHDATTSRGDAALASERRQRSPTFFQEHRLPLALDHIELGRADQRRDHTRNLPSLKQDALDVRRSNHPCPAHQAGFASLQRGIHQGSLPRIELHKQRRQSPSPCLEVVVDHAASSATRPVDLYLVFRVGIPGPGTTPGSS